MIGGDDVRPARRSIDAILDGLGDRVPTTRCAAMVTAAVLADDARDALITAGAVARRRPRRRRPPTRLRAGADDGRELDVVAAIADHTRQPVGSVVASLDAARDAAALARPARRRSLGGVAMAAAAGALSGAGGGPSPRRRRGWRSPSAAAGVANLALWWARRPRLVAPPLDAGDRHGPGSWSLPAGLRVLLADVQQAIADDLAGTVRRYGGACSCYGRRRWAPARRRPALAAAGARRATVAVAGAVAAAVAVVGGLVAATSARDERACNGHVELCDRGYDDVVYAATHNSMSSPDVVPVWPEHDGDIRGPARRRRPGAADRHPLLAAGRRRRRAGRRARRDRAAGPGGPGRGAGTATLGVVPRRAARAPSCATSTARSAPSPFVDALTVVRAFLDENPDDVVTLIIQDAISTADTAAC